MKHILYKINQSWLHFLMFWNRRWIDLQYLVARITGKEVALPEGALNPMLMVGAIMDVEEKLQLERMSSSAALLYSQLIRNELPDEAAMMRATTMYESKRKRRAVYEVMLHYKDILPHQVNSKFLGEARAEFEAWLDK